MSTITPSNRLMLETLRRALAGQLEPFPSDSKKARGAVGVLIKEEGDDLWLLMIKRRENPRDPWSGQMAFPGGHADPQDRTLFDTVAREALEEVGIDLRKQEFLGCLSNLQPKNAPMIVSPFLFLAKQKVDPKTSVEAQEVLWIPMSFLLNPKNVSSIRVQMGREQVSMGCYRYSDHIIWGLSFRIIQEIISKITSSH
jgi:8-oxo-dGTP pyrophosphatase MutT (NUDIX family)